MAKRSRKGNDQDAALAAGNNNGRQVAGTGYAFGKVDAPSATDFSYGLTKRTGNAKGGSIPDAGTKRNRGPVMQDRLGPRFSIQAKLPGGVAPEAALTQSNTRFVPSAINRSAPNFNYGRMG